MQTRHEFADLHSAMLGLWNHTGHEKQSNAGYGRTEMWIIGMWPLENVFCRSGVASRASGMSCSAAASVVQEETLVDRPREMKTNSGRAKF